jgi:hypothetical protein
LVVRALAFPSVFPNPFDVMTSLPTKFELIVNLKTAKALVDPIGILVLGDEIGLDLDDEVFGLSCRAVRAVAGGTGRDVVGIEFVQIDLHVELLSRASPRVHLNDARTVSSRRMAIQS